MQEVPDVNPQQLAEAVIGQISLKNPGMLSEAVVSRSMGFITEMLCFIAQRATTSEAKRRELLDAVARHLVAAPINPAWDVGG